MIVGMSKVEIIGPKELLLPVLELLKQLGVFQVEPDIRGFIAEGKEAEVRSLLLDEKSLAQRIYFEDLRRKIDDLCACFPMVAARKSYLDPQSVIDVIAATAEKHVAYFSGICLKKEAMRREERDLGRYTAFLGAIENLLAGVALKSGLEFIGVTIREPELVENLRLLLARLTAGRFELVTSKAADGTVVGLISTAKEYSERVKRALSDEHIPELSFPASFDHLSFPEKIDFAQQRLAELAAGIAAIDRELERFAGRWLAIYQRVREWLDDRLSLLRQSAMVHETCMCFFIHGWMPSADVTLLGKELNGRFSGKVVVEEKRMLEEDLDRVPVALKNPTYFKPFELFARLLPLPRYTSFDPTTFIGIFFPLFFGMILGDVGYGLILLVVSLILLKRVKKRAAVRDGAKILLISSTYAIVFGLFYGEFFGSLGTTLTGLETPFISRERGVAPMLIFSLTVGLVQVVLGLSLGFLSAVRRKTKREALFKLLNIIIILCLATLLVSFFELFPRVLAGPVIVALLAAVLLLIVTGGLLAPLELLKNIGNIISYARIMAIGLASVLLANVANRLGGMTGDVVTGAVVAGLLHAVNLVLGVFSPTIQSLRLHYVEFFSKFLEAGGRRFEPFKKDH